MDLRPGSDGITPTWNRMGFPPWSFLWGMSL
jgi:hypothetical protein